MSRRDELIKLIAEKTAEKEELRNQWRSYDSDASRLDTLANELEAQLAEIRTKVLDTKREWHAVTREKTLILNEGKSVAAEITALERELRQISDSERIASEIRELSNKFKNSCLDASWRPENRKDGYGAFSYQIDGAISLAVAKRAMLGDERGLGKSLTSLIYMDLLSAAKIIAICPSDTMHNFAREVRLWTPHRIPIVIGSMPVANRDFLLEGAKEMEQFIVIVNYEAWRQDNLLIDKLRALKPDTVVIDESHSIMNHQTDAFTGVEKIVFADNYCECGYPDIVKGSRQFTHRRCRNCGKEDSKLEFSTVKNVVPISGTAIMNKPQDLWAQLHIIEPNLFPMQTAFLQDYCRQDSGSGRWTWELGGESRLVKKLGSRYVKRTRKDAGIELPPVTPVEHIITQSIMKDQYPDQWKAYEQVREYAQMVLDPDNDVTMSMPNKVTVLMRLRQVLVWPNAITLKDKDGLEIARLNVFESCKIDEAERIIRQSIEEGDRVVLFSQFTDGLEELRRRIGVRACLYQGSTTQAMRQAIQHDFDVKTAPANPRWDVVLANYRSGGQGLNFNAANRIIRLDLPWGPGREDQAEGRTDRLGQTKDQYLHTISVERSVDTWMQSIITQKANIISGFQEEIDFYRAAFEALQSGEM